MDKEKIIKTKSLDEAKVAKDPFSQFRLWFDEALGAKFYEPTAVTCATVSEDGRPSARIVLLKHFDEKGFVFYTNYESRKAKELEKTPMAALVFWWDQFVRQVTIEGDVKKISPEESDAYFQTRPRESRLSAWASCQSQVIASREVLEERMRELEKKYENKEIPRPPFWGGYLVIPSLFEFWQGRAGRMNDRLRYQKNPQGNWFIERLSP